MKNRKSLLSVLLVLFMIISSLISTSGIVLAADGKGSESSPYLIKTAADLFNIPTGSTSYYKLANDIDLGTVKKDPMGLFCGVLDGDGYTISNLTIIGAASTQYIALFGLAEDATFRNIKITGANVTTSSNYAGILTGYSFNTNFENCSVTSSKITGATGLCGI